MLAIQKFSFNPIQENTYVLYAENGNCCIIDPGCYFDEERKALHEFITANKLKPVFC